MIAACYARGAGLGGGDPAPQDAVSPFDVGDMLKADGVRLPRQARSRATFERLLDAAEELLEHEGVDGTSMAAVAQRAGSSIGALYTRVPDKTTLVRAVQLRLVGAPGQRRGGAGGSRFAS